MCFKLNAVCSLISKNYQAWGQKYQIFICVLCFAASDPVPDNKVFVPFYHFPLLLTFFKVGFEYFRPS